VLIGVIADDFTGANDIGNGLPGQGGLVTSHHMGVPRRAEDTVAITPTGCDGLGDQGRGWNIAAR